MNINNNNKISNVNNVMLNPRVIKNNNNNNVTLNNK